MFPFFKSRWVDTIHLYSVSPPCICAITVSEMQNCDVVVVSDAYFSDIHFDGNRSSPCLPAIALGRNIPCWSPIGFERLAQVHRPHLFLIRVAADCRRSLNYLPQEPIEEGKEEQERPVTYCQ